MSKQLSEHFSLREFTESYIGTRLGINNTPPADALICLQALCCNLLEPLRVKLKKPITVNSGYRCPALNRAVGGARTSQHMKGQAADIEVAGMPNLKLGEFIEKNFGFDQLIYEFCKPNDPTAGWIHVSWVSKAKNRRQVIRID